MVQLLYVRVAPGGSSEADVTDVRWYNPETGGANVATVAGMVQFIQENRGRAYVCDGHRIVEIEVAQIDGRSFIRMVPDRDKPLGLLSLPRF